MHPLIISLWLLWAYEVLRLYAQNTPFLFGAFSSIVTIFTSLHVMHPYTWISLKGIAVAAWLFWLAIRTGRWILKRWLPSPSLTSGETLVWGAAIGWGVLAYLVLLSGALRIWYPAVFWMLGISSSIFFLAADRPATEAALAADSQFSFGFRNIFWLFLLGILFSMMFVAALSPEINYDVLSYHLAVPDLFRTLHRLDGLPTLVTSSFVMTIHMLFGLAITLGPTIAAKLVSLMFTLLLMFAMFVFAKRYLSDEAGLLSAVFFFSAPLAWLLSTDAMVEIPWACLQFLAAYALVRSFGEKNKNGLRLAGFLTGLVASCKFMAMPVLPVAMLVIVWQKRTEGRGNWAAVRSDLAHFAWPALLALSPVLLKTAAFHGNPLYPFGGMHWGHPEIDPTYWQLLQRDARAQNLFQHLEDSHALLRWLLSPWTTTMAEHSLEDFVGPLYLMVLPFSLILPIRNRPLRWMTRYGVMLLGIVFMNTAVVRYELPALALLCPVMAETIVTACRGRWVRFPVLVILLLGIMNNVLCAGVILRDYTCWAVPAGLAVESQVLNHPMNFYPAPPYDGIQWMNSHLPEGSKILFAGESRFYGSRHAVIPSSTYDPAPIVEYAKESRDGNDMAQRLRAAHVTHIYINFIEAARTESYQTFRWDNTSWATFIDFWSHWVKLDWKEEEDNGMKMQYVFEILSEPVMNSPSQVAVNPFVRWKPAAK